MMAQNINPHASHLLTWHGTAAGGVHVPFRTVSSPMGSVIVTPLVERLRQLAASIASDPMSRPRWIFLVGGPGNGKSETVQDFLFALDSCLNLNGILVDALKRAYTQPQLVPRTVTIEPSDLHGDSSRFSTHIGRLMVVQDATATETASGNAAKELADEIAALFTHPTTPVPVFVACANRGLLSRAMHEASAYGDGNPVSALLASVIQASSLGRETLAGRRRCWPLETDARFACWPLDVESLIASTSEQQAPVASILERATEHSQWDVKGRCLDCDAASMCPLRQNATWLRDGDTRNSLLTMLRRGELARGQRWNFRDAFSLVAELIVGQWSDFESCRSPCEWVHLQHGHIAGSTSETAATTRLVGQLYPNAVFRGGVSINAAKAFLDEYDIDSATHPATSQILSQVALAASTDTTKPIREILSQDYARLDPASFTDPDTTNPLRLVEDSFCQSVAQGVAAFQSFTPSTLELCWHTLLEKAEGEWDVLGVESATARAAVRVLRRLGSTLAKRSAGVRLGFHALQGYLREYESALRNPMQLQAIRAALQPLLGYENPRFNMLEILGQPTADTQPLVTLVAPSPGWQPVPAPEGTSHTPGHDVPCIEFKDPDYRVPLSFDFFMALRLRKDGCAGSSLPASVRAAIDGIRHRYAGYFSKQDQLFADGRANIGLAPSHTLTLPAVAHVPHLASE
jgi:hypothetical protein